MKNRKVFEELLKQGNDRKISLLIGARQVGKTTLLKALFERICIEQKNRGIFLDLDIFSNFEKISTFENLLNFIKLNGYEEQQKEFFYLFLDEFQRYSELQIVMKNVYDNLKNVKIYASGSSSIKIKSQIQESLAGRKKLNLVYPLDFEEFLWFKEDLEAIKYFANVTKLKGDKLYSSLSKLNAYLEEFLVFGGYPEVVLQKKNKDKITILESIFDLYVKKDLVEYLNIKKIMNFKKLIEHLAINHSRKIKYEELSQISSLSYNELLNYIEILKETYLIHVSRPFFTNKNKELVKIPKIYFIDSGVRNFFINNFNSTNIREDKGFLFEGCMVSEFIKTGIGPEKIKFWEDKNAHEVDILIDTLQTQIPIEIKFKKNLKTDDLTSLYAFFKEYPKIKEGYLINLNQQKKVKDINFKLPFKVSNILPA